MILYLHSKPYVKIKYNKKRRENFQVLILKCLMMLKASECDAYIARNLIQSR